MSFYQPLISDNTTDIFRSTPFVHKKFSDFHEIRYVGKGRRSRSRSRRSEMCESGRFKGYLVHQYSCRPNQ